MEQIENSICQRHNDQLEIINIPNKTKQQYLIREKQRTQYENSWLKAIKNPSLQAKKQIYKSTLKIMQSYNPEMIQETFDINTQFTQSYINLYAKFYSGNQEVLRMIVRPNNNNIIYDLLKTLVEYSRSKLKNAFVRTFKDFINKRQPRQIYMANKAGSIRQKTLSVKQVSATEQTLIQESECINYNENIYQRCKQFVSKQFEAAKIEEKINIMYTDLLAANYTNRQIISNFRDECLGKRRNLAYNFSSLYSNEQKNRFISELHQDINRHEQNIKLARINQCNLQLKDHFKQYVALQDKKEKFIKKIAVQCIHKWLPIALTRDIKNNDDLLLGVVIHKEYVHKDKIKAITNRDFKDYLLQKLNDKYERIKNCEQRPVLLKNHKKLRTQLFFDHNRRTIKQLLINPEKIIVKKDSSNTGLPSIVVPFEKIKIVSQKSKLKESQEKSFQKLAPLGKSQSSGGCYNKTIDASTVRQRNTCERIHNSKMIPNQINLTKLKNGPKTSLNSNQTHLNVSSAKKITSKKNGSESTEEIILNFIHRNKFQF